MGYTALVPMNVNTPYTLMSGTVGQTGDFRNR